MGFVYTGGRTGGFESNSNAPYVVIQHSDRKIGLLGITNPNSPIDYKSRNQTNAKDLDVRFTDSGGVTSGVRVYQNAFTKVNEGQIFTDASPRIKVLEVKNQSGFLVINKMLPLNWITQVICQVKLHGLWARNSRIITFT